MEQKKFDKRNRIATGGEKGRRRIERESRLSFR